MITNLLTLIIDDKIFALDINCVERVIPSVEITTIPELPDYIKGVINYQSKIIPIINNRKLFLIEEKEIDLEDMFIIISYNSKMFCIISDSTDEIISCEESDILNSKNISSNLKLTKGIIEKDGKIIIVYDINEFIQLEEYQFIDKRL